MHFRYKISCHCGEYLDGEAGSLVGDSVVYYIQRFVDKHKDCKPKRRTHKNNQAKTSEQIK